MNSCVSQANESSFGFFSEEELLLSGVTVGVVNYNGMSTLPGTIKALRNPPYDQLKIIVLDNKSMDGSREWLQTNYPDIECLCLDSNIGVAGAREVLLNYVDTDYILFLDNDITLEKNTLSELMKVMRSVPRLAICHPEICDPNDDWAFHYNGGWIHYLGAYISREKATDNRPEYELFDIVSGAAMLVDRIAALAIGGFDQDYFFNWEDGDFVSRLVLAGYRVSNVPHAVVQHIGKPRGTSKAYYMVRNRWFFMLKLYSWKTLILITPALLAFEALSAIFMLFKGEFLVYLRANWDALKALPEILKKRAVFQKNKVVKDRDWLKAGEIYISQSAMQRQPLVSMLMKPVQFLFSGYWAIVRPLC